MEYNINNARKYEVRTQQQVHTSLFYMYISYTNEDTFVVYDTYTFVHV